MPKGDQILLRQMCELLNLRMERYKDRLVDENSESLRGQAKELKELLKVLTAV